MRYESISNELFKRNRNKAIHLLKDNSMAIINAADRMPRNGDLTYQYRQSSDLFYFTGIEQEETVLLLFPQCADEKQREILFILKPDKKLETWEGKKLTMEEASAISGIKNVRYVNEFESLLKQLVSKADFLYLNRNENLRYSSDIETRDDRFIRKVREWFPLHSLERLAPIITTLRVIKEPEEIALISRACSITRNSFYRVLHTVRPGMKEYEIEAEITYEFIKSGASGHAYEPIVASGQNACFLHYNKNNSIVQKGDLVLIDFGAEYANYASDCTRTIPVGGTYSTRQAQVYRACYDVFTFARSLMVPGTTIKQYHKEVCKKMEEELIRLGLFTRQDVEQQERDNPMFCRYYMHGTSHFMGLDTHDVGEKDIVLRPGMVLTCEPGIYIPAERIGIRIEDDILITEGGNIDLMDDIPVELSDIESYMKQL